MRNVPSTDSELVVVWLVEGVGRLSRGERTDVGYRNSEPKVV